MPRFKNFECQGCTERFPLCWNSCESYKKALSEYRAQVKAERDYKDNVSAGFITKRVRKMET